MKKAFLSINQKERKKRMKKQVKNIERIKQYNKNIEQTSMIFGTFKNMMRQYLRNKKQTHFQREQNIGKKRMVLFLILLMIGAVDCGCPVSSISGLVTARKTLMGEGESSYRIGLGSDFKATPSVGMGVWELKHEGRSHGGRTSVQVTQIAASNVLLTFITQSGGWEKIHICLWATTRDDILTNTAHFHTMIRGRTTVQQIPISIESPHTSILRVYLNGYRQPMQSPLLDLSLSANSTTPHAISINIQVGMMTLLSDVWLSYLVFSPSTLPFASYGGSMVVAQDAVKDMHNILHYPQYVFAGISEMKATGPVQVGFEVDEDVVGGAVVQGDVEAKWMYVLVGVSPNRTCGSCEGKLPYHRQCVQACPPNTYIHQYRDGGKGCHHCSPKLHTVFNPHNQTCDCASTHHFVDRSCIAHSELCPMENSYWDGDACACIQGYVSRDGRCIRRVSSCSYLPNSYWNGFSCACRVGYRYADGLCLQYATIQKCGNGQFFTGAQCRCFPGYQRVEGECVSSQNKKNETNDEEEKKLECGELQVLVDDKCECKQGFKFNGRSCVKIVISCPNHEVYNGYQCVCMGGTYRDVAGACVEQIYCPLNAHEQNGVCVCDVGFFEGTAGRCERCAQGQYYYEGNCIYICKQHEEWQNGRCVCVAGYGKRGKVCGKCEGKQFLRDGYCVSCQVNAHHDGDGCVCDDGYHLLDAICQSVCSIHEVFQQGKCRCLQGMGRVNGQCTQCPGLQRPNPSTQNCEMCSIDQVPTLTSCSRVLCVGGQGRYGQQCVDCTKYGLYMLDGMCVSCPEGQVWAGQSCVCPVGTARQNQICVDVCGDDRLRDSDGRCYTCAVDEEISQGVCVCRSGYARDGSGRCVIQCRAEQIVINGHCARCALNSVYDPYLKTCVCPGGHYKHMYGYCVESRIPILDCRPGQYLHEVDGCIPCEDGCAQCDRQGCQRCTSEYFQPVGFQCESICGDGVMVAHEGCDDGNMRGGDGCSGGCELQEEWKCKGQPSICVSIHTIPPNCGDNMHNADEECDDGNDVNGDGCNKQCMVEEGYNCEGVFCVRPHNNIEMMGELVVNSGAVYLTIETSPAFNFSSRSEMRNFMKFAFYDPSAQPSRADCIQRITDLKTFNCIFLYPSGVPVHPFKLTLSFQKSQYRGSADVIIDTKPQQFSFRSLY